MAETSSSVDNKSTEMQHVSEKVHTFTDSEFNDVAKGIRLSSEERGAQKERARLQAEYEALRQKDREEAAQIAREAAQKQVEEMHKKNLEREQERQQAKIDENIKEKLLPKFTEAKEKYSDWTDTVLSYDWQKPELAQILPLLADVDEPDEVLRDLCASGNIEKLMHKRVDHILNELKRTSDSIKNRREKSTDHLPEPIKPLKPSHVKTKGDGDYTIEDFRKASWLKG